MANPGTGQDRLLPALHEFARAVAEKSSQPTPGEPEDQLRAPFEAFVAEVARALGVRAVCTGETPLPGRLGRPDYAIHLDGLLAGFVELKAPGAGADPAKFTGRDREQWRRFQNIPNLLYCDGAEWALYRDGERVGDRVRFGGGSILKGADAVRDEDAGRLEDLFRDYLSWRPFIPVDERGRIDLPGFAGVLAPACRMLRDDVAEALAAGAASPMDPLAREWRHLLFPDASDEQFADAYSQTVAFAMLLARTEGAEPLDWTTAAATLAPAHGLLGRALQVLTDPDVRAEMSASLETLRRILGTLPRGTMAGRDDRRPGDPWLYFYEDFLAAYDPKLRKDAGAYYTPVEVVRAQVRLVDDLLVERAGRPLGFADKGVVTLDPATGTGTYLLGVIEHALGRVESELGPGAVPGHAAALASNLYGFEFMAGPYAVAELRVTRALEERGADLSKVGTRVFLTDTLENPRAESPQAIMGFAQKAFAEQHRKATRVKWEVPVLVCLGNPPYDRHAPPEGAGATPTGGWIRNGEDGQGRGAIFSDFLEPILRAGHGVHAKNLYNLYVYFWRWALWKVFEHRDAGAGDIPGGAPRKKSARVAPAEFVHGPGIVSFITASSYLDGDTFAGMREWMRRDCDEIWILDIGGEGRGSRKSENVFAIRTPVAIAIAFRDGAPNPDKPARVRYARFDGTRAEKLAALDRIRTFRSVKWTDCPKKWSAPFRPAGKGEFFKWPALADLMPWRHSGGQFKRTWPISHDREILKRRWVALLAAENRAEAFRVTRDRDLETVCKPFRYGGRKEPALKDVPRGAAHPIIGRYSFRSLDRQWAFLDCRLGDYFRPALWHAHGPRQIHLVSSFAMEVGEGPAAMCATAPPDQHCYSGRGGKDVLPLYRDAEATEPNVLPGLLALLGKTYGLARDPSPEDLLAYLYGVLAHPGFTSRFAEELATREIRLPLTKDPALFARVRDAGARLVWLHTYGERMVPKGKRPGQVPRGKARCSKAVPATREGYPETFEYVPATRTLKVGDGEFAPVAPEVFDYAVSGLKVVPSWLRYRMKHGAGKKSSPLDDIRPESWTAETTTELLELLWVLEETVAAHPELESLLDEVRASECFDAAELPPVPKDARKPPVMPEAEYDMLSPGDF